MGARWPGKGRDALGFTRIRIFETEKDYCKRTKKRMMFGS
ncbi:hypothetical protein V6Z11_D07G167400 [Gossypium hirsutum]